MRRVSAICLSTFALSLLNLCPRTGQSAETVSVGLEEAVEIALARSYRLRQAKLDLQAAKDQTAASYSPVWPQVNANAGYTRNIVAPNPFAGSSAGGLFDGLNSLGWLAYNEAQRTDPNAMGGTISLAEFQRRQVEGQAAAGYNPSSNSNPFFVPNAFNLGISVSQVLYNGAAFTGIKGADKYLETTAAGLDVEALNVVSQTAQAFYGALLAREQTKILQNSVDRTRTTLQETTKRVSQGVLPQFAQLSAEVELANLQTQKLRADNQAQAALDGLKATIGLPPAQAITLRGTLQLEDEPPALPPMQDALQMAMDQRPDVRQARLYVQTLEIQEKVTWSEYLPVVQAVANLGYQGNVPDDRTLLVSAGDPNDPFAYQTQTNSFFSGSYWNPSFSVGLNLTWNIFNGFRTSNTLKQNRVATSRARLQLNELEDAARIQVEQAQRNVQTALQQIETQARNIERAELNYKHAEIRVREGVSTQLELREASNLLDNSRFAHRQAIHDYLVARASYDVALGTPPVSSKETP